MFFFVPCGLIIRDRYDNLALAPEVEAPSLVIHGDRDGTISIELGKRLAEALPMLKHFARAEGYGHNDLLYWDEYWPSIQTFLASLDPVKKPR